MNSRNRRGSPSFRPVDERLESRLVLSGNPSVSAEIKAILVAAGGSSPVRPNTPVLPFESPYASATFLDPSVNIINGKGQKIGQKDYIAPNVTLNAKKGGIVIGSSSTIEDDAQILANPSNRSGRDVVSIGDHVVVGDNAVIEGPATIGARGGAATSIGPDALIDGAVIAPGAFVGALARVGPGVTVPTGYRVLPGANVTSNAQADTPSLGFVVKVTSTDTAPSNATRAISDSVALAIGYSTLYQGNAAAGGAASAGPIPSAVSASGSTIYFGGLNAVLGVSSEPGSTRGVPFEPATGTTPTFLLDGSPQPIAINLAYRFPARVIGAVSFIDQSSAQFRASLGIGSGRDVRITLGDTIRGDEGQPIAIESIRSLGSHVSIRSPLGGVQGSTTLGAIAIGEGFAAGDDATILGSPTSATTIEDGVTVGADSVVVGSTIGRGAVVGNKAYVSRSTIPAGGFVPDGEILINNQIVGTVEW